MDLLTLVRQDTGAEFRQAATTDGGEHTGPCPICGDGGKGHKSDRFNVWPNHHTGKAHFWCRMCLIAGDLADYLQAVHGMTTREALDAMGKSTIGAYNTNKAKRPAPVTPNVYPPKDAWQARARAFVEYAQGQLWGDLGYPALEYLRVERSLSEETIRHFGLGYNPRAYYDDAATWGVEGSKVYLSPGVVIPCSIGEALWYVQVRRPYDDGARDRLSAYLEYVPDWRPEVKYMAVKGGEGKALYGADDLRGDRPVLLCEGEFDTMLAWQELRDHVDVATLGGAKKASGGIPGRWMLRLLPYETILVAFDADQAGRSGAADLLRQSKRAHRVIVPKGDDLTAFHQERGDLAAWVTFQLATVRGMADVPLADAPTQCKRKSPR